MSDSGSTLRVIEAGTVSYEEGLRIQAALVSDRIAGRAGDTVLILEHPPVMTKGRRSDPDELGMGEDWYRMQGIEVVATDRGGRVTYHGPGQSIVYPIVDLRGLGGGRGLNVGAYVSTLERAMIAALARFGIDAQVFGGLAGVWTAGGPPVSIGADGPQGTTVTAGDPELAARSGEARKIGSIGIHVSRGVASHGLAVNVSNDLQPFEWILPCGLEAARMTSVAVELRRRDEAVELRRRDEAAELRGGSETPGIVPDATRFSRAVSGALATQLGVRAAPAGGEVGD